MPHTPAHRRPRGPARYAAIAIALLVALAAGIAGLPQSAAAAANETTLFGTSVPAIAADADRNAVELGVTFTPRVDGTVHGVRFHKGSGNTGTHRGSLWNASGSRLAIATFTNETATGWQEVRFATPVQVKAGQKYVASYHAPRGRYSATRGFFDTAYTRGDLTAPANGGTYRYGSTSQFPTSSFAGSNYFVDVVFSAGVGTPSPTPPPTPTPTPQPTTPSSNFNPGNPSGTAAVPAGKGGEDVSAPDHVIGTGNPASCTSAAVVAAVKAGGVITFNCGPNPHTITLAETLKVPNNTRKLVIDGGGKVTLSGANQRRILYVDTCDTSLGSVSGNCLYAPQFPQVTVQNITFADGNATNSTYVSPGHADQHGNGGGAIFQLGGQLKVVRSAFVRNTCAPNGPDLGGGAIRVLAQHSPTPNDLDASYAARNQVPVHIVQSTFGGASGQGNNCSNGGAISGLRTPITVINSLVTHNNAIGCCANPAKPGTPGGGSGGALYADGTTFDVNILGTDIQHNTAKAGGSAIFFVSNDRTGKLVIDRSTIRNNSYAPSGQSTPQSFETHPGIFYLGAGRDPVITNSTVVK